MAHAHLRIGYVGEPGERAFHIQAVDGSTTVTFDCEKQQVAGIAALLENLLARLDLEPAESYDRSVLEISQPIASRWRVGTITVGLKDDLSELYLVLEEWVDAEPDSVEKALADKVRIPMSIQEAQILARHTADIVDEGRPAGEEGRLVRDAKGHAVFPSTNGHGYVRREALLQEVEFDVESLLEDE